ncbi:hypothetical protein [Fluviicola chungangensis]|uniref:Uncharacterized protein n=1 Tax=Fluviicola chungangensis TaxID=2597671 RepID=A0A556MY27_9FLAO|nr:hypothetical protein [Fluviicola chungangensis]TSJ44820.1 hypothetical protein FO442_09475 [Fluviicola chungangensis]
MSESNIQHIGIKDYFELTINLIARDLKIHRHLHFLSLSGVDTSLLSLQLNQDIFKLIGFEKTDLINEIEEWYFKQAERVFTIDTVNNTKALLELSAEILNGLNKFRILAVPNKKSAF